MVETGIRAMACSLTRCLRRSLGNTPPSNTAASLKRLLSCPAFSSKEEAIAIDMIKYANSLKDDEPSYSEAVRVLEQGLSYFTEDRLPSTMASGRLQLSLATIHANRSNFEAATECLQQLVNTRSVPLEIKGAAYEALTALCLQMHQDKAALDHADSFTKLLEETVDSHAVENLRAMKCQALALKRLVELVHTSSNAEFVDLEASPLSDLENASGGAVLAFAESSHVQGSFSLARNMYEKAISLSKKELEENGQRLSAIAMVPEAVQTGATAGLGQLLAVMGEFEEAETQLTQALKQAEKVKGEKHPQVGVILSCIGNLYHQRGMAQGSSELLLTEGMYKSALDLMKAPPLDKEIDQSEQFMEIVALTRARLGATLAPALYRRSEIEKLKGWVEATWRNSRPLPELLYLKELLSGDKGSKPLREDKNIIGETTVVDVRLGRVFYK